MKKKELRQEQILKIIETYGNITDAIYTALFVRPIPFGCTFGNFDSLWNEGQATCEKVVKDGKNAIKIFYRLYANARSYAGTYTVTGRAKVFFYLQGDVRSLLYD